MDKEQRHRSVKAEKVFERLWGREVAKGGFTQIPRRIIQKPRDLHKDIKSQHVAILVYLISRWNYNQPLPFCSISTMTKDLRQGKDSLVKKLKDLERWGLLKKMKRRKKHNPKEWDSNQYDLKPLAELVAAKQKEADELEEFLK